MPLQMFSGGTVTVLNDQSNIDTRMSTAGCKIQNGKLLDCKAFSQSCDTVDFGLICICSEFPMIQKTFCIRWN